MSDERRRLAFALLLSLLLHAPLLALTFGGQGLGLPGIGFFWGDRRIETTELRVVLAPRPLPAAEPAITAVPAPLAERPPTSPAAAPSARPPGEKTVAILPGARKPPVAESTPDAVARAAPAKAPTRAVRSHHVARAKVRTPSAASVPTPKSAAPAVRAQPSAATPFVPVPPIDASPDTVTSALPNAGDVPREAERLGSAQEEWQRQAAERREAARLAEEQLEAQRRERPGQAEASRAEARRQESERQEAARAAVAQDEARRDEAARQVEAARVEAARREAERLESARIAAEQMETQRRELARQEEEAARIDAVRRAAEREQAARLAAEQLEAQRRELARQEEEAARIESVRRAAEREQAARLGAERREAQRQEAARPAPAQQAAAGLPAGQEEAKRQERLRAIGRQLDEEAAERDKAAAAAGSRSNLPLALGTARRVRLFGRTHPNEELVRYAEAWAQKIQLNTPVETVRDAATRLRNSPVVTVAVRSDGSVESVTFELSSGAAEVDEAIRGIVRSHEHYQMFPPALARDYDVIEIRRTWHFDVAVRLQ